MSIRFPTDNDSGMSGRRPPRQPGGGGRLVFMLIFGVIAFMVIRGMTSRGPATPADPVPGDRSGEYGSTQYPDLQSDQDQQRADQGDWGLEDGPVQRNAQSKKPSSKSSNGDWGMESVATKRDEKTSAGRFSKSTNSPIKESENKQPTTNGDWSLDSNIKSTPKLTEPKKTTKGDWGLEEVD